MKTFGLIGKKLTHSFSSHYFQKKFLREDITDAQYLNFEIDTLQSLRDLIAENNIKGLNVTIPYKERIIPFLDEISKEANEVGSVNTIQIKGEKILGYNTDIYGFEKSFLPLINGKQNAIVLGSGGASKAIQFVLKRNNISYLVASRDSDFTIEQIDKNILQKNDVIINATPLGMYPKTTSFPDLPYNFINTKHLLFDLVYNPRETIFLANGKANGAQIKNGKQMLHLQAEESWKIWN